LVCGINSFSLILDSIIYRRLRSKRSFRLPGIIDGMADNNLPIASTKRRITSVMPVAVNYTLRIADDKCGMINNTDGMADDKCGVSDVTSGIINSKLETTDNKLSIINSTYYEPERNQFIRHDAECG